MSKTERVPFVPLAPEEVRSLTHGMTEHVRGAVVLGVATGLRQGEIFGLTVDRVDFLRRELRVDRQLFTAGRGEPFLKPPKSANSYRTIALSPMTVDALAAHIEVFGTGTEGLVFHTKGRPIGRSMTSKYIRMARTAAAQSFRTVAEQLVGDERLAAQRHALAVELASWHDLRQYHGSTLLAAGVNPSKVAERLGHDVKTLLTTYAHVMPRDDDRVRSIVDATLGLTAEEWLRSAMG